MRNQRKFKQYCLSLDSVVSFINEKLHFMPPLKGQQGQVAVNKPVISRIYIVAYTWPLCSAQIFVDELNPH